MRSDWLGGACGNVKNVYRKPTKVIPTQRGEETTQPKKYEFLRKKSKREKALSSAPSISRGTKQACNVGEHRGRARGHM